MRSHVTLWIWCVPLGLPFLYGILFQSIPAILLLSLVAVLLVPIVLLGILAAAVVAAKAGHRRQAVVTGGAALFLLAEAAYPSIFWQPVYTAGLWIGFVPFYGFYKLKVAALPQDKGPRHLAIDFGYAGPLGHALFFDESDRIATPLQAGERPVGLIDTDQIEPCDGRSIHLARHYYACSYWTTM